MNQDNSTILSIDVGARRIGVAIASVKAKLPRPLTTLTMSDEVLTHIDRLVQSESVTRIIVGLPLDMHRRETDSTRRAREFAGNLSAQFPHIPVEMFDETLTSREAEDILKFSKKQYKKADIDAEAARIILERYLNDTSTHDKQI